MGQESEIIVLAEGKFIRFLKRGSWEYTERANCTGIVMIVSMTEENKVILIEQFRPPVQAKVIEFPAGLTGDLENHKDEDIEKAAQREFIEETGYKAAHFEKLLISPIACGSSADKFTILRAHGIRQIGQGGGDQSENIKVHEVPLCEVDTWLARKKDEGCLIDSKIYAGLYFLKQYNTVS